MSKLELLNNIVHKDMRVNTKKSKTLGDSVNGSLIFPAEFVEAHKEYPIYFQKNSETGDFQAVVLFGFGGEENLFLNENGWDARYIPALMRREPFYIGFQEQADSGDAAPVIHVDMDSARICRGDEGERLFLENGENTAFLTGVSRTLMLIHEGFDKTKAMFDEFLKLDLLEPFTLDIVFDDQSVFQTNNYFTLSQEKLYALDDDVIAGMHRSGCLQYAHMVLQSLSNIRGLIDRRNTLR